QGNGNVLATDRRGLQEIVGLDQDLCRQAGGKSLQDIRNVVGSDADQVIGKPGQLVRIEAAGGKALEEKVVLGAIVSAFDLELGDRHRLGELRHCRQPLAISFERLGAACEDEIVR